MRSQTIAVKVLKTSLLFFILSSFVLTPAGLGPSADASGKLADKYKDALKLKPVDFSAFSEAQLPMYANVVQKQMDEGVADVKGTRVEISSAAYSAFGSLANAAPELKSGIGDKAQEVLLWQEDVDWIEWPVEVPEDGFYNIELTYYPIEGKRSSIDRALKIDNQFPFNEAQRLAFYRMWADKAEPVLNSKGDHIRPKQVEVPRWETVRLVDNEGKHPEPFRFYMTKGKHTLRMETLKEPVAIEKLALVSPEDPPSYEQVKQAYADNGYKETKDRFVKIQAEKAWYKTDPTIRRESGSDPLVEPAAGGNLILNVIGDYRWRKGGQYITWKLDVPEDGLYKIAFKVGQWWGDGLPGYRKIELDGKVPFKELEQYSFRYDRDYYIETLGNKNEHYLFYLTKGEHTLKMTAQLGPYTDVIQSLSDTIFQISKVNRDIIKVTGTKPDLNFRYELEKRIPTIIGDLDQIIEGLSFQIEELRDIAGKSPAIVESLKMIRDQYRQMRENPDKIPVMLEDITNTQGQLGNWMLSLKETPLVMDYIVVASPDERMPRAMSNLFQRMWSMTQNFITSFYKDYDSVGDNFGGTGENKVIDVWVGNGREWAELLKDLADEDFTPETGIYVNVNTIPAGQLAVGSANTLLLAASSGRAPDVATSAASTLPVEFSIRGAVADLSKFPDFDEVAKQFLPGSLIPFQYNGGVYALPETQDFNLLLYRKDILSELNLGIPETWEDFYKMLPILQRNGMNAWVPAVIDPFLYQHGGSFYSDDLTETGLNTPEAYAAFKEWTDLYTNYRLPIQADFFNRMRSGEMPIGLGGYQMYVLLATAAPELAGRWGIAPAPGIRKEDGTVDRTAGGAVTGTVIFNDSDKKEESWQFVKWWMSKETQLRFGQELESLLGVEARWNSANIEAFEELPWSKEDLATFKEQWKWYREQPVVPGGYFTARHIANAWNRVVLSAVNPRESLEQAVKDINKELRAKQEEFGFKVSTE
ncbi:extracellular solute-binding protein [Paenibacillus thermotolerans]|uniref:extracellular solute-binding protein n=1 Tax=Paenibacillus thermotolerans TaxID=3027807 RepID=UPI002368E61E|nr:MULTISPECIES: extracellular solute-binding protein [unclassified Paenibacillus]